jgi:hypothetical protein
MPNPALQSALNLVQEKPLNGIIVLLRPEVKNSSCFFGFQWWRSQDRHGSEPQRGSRLFGKGGKITRAKFPLRIPIVIYLGIRAGSSFNHRMRGRYSTESTTSSSPLGMLHFISKSSYFHRNARLFQTQLFFLTEHSVESIY